MNNISVLQSLGGGALIGSAAILLMWTTGRIAGISNIAAHAFFRPMGDGFWRILFLFGLVAGSGAYYLFFGNMPVPRTSFPSWLLGIAGFLVGFGTSLANGCTSGHGVCGIGRLSLRSLIATIIFLSCGIATAVVVRHVLGVV